MHKRIMKINGKNCISLWQEDDATPGTEGHETLAMAWKRLFGTDYKPETALSREDHGDCDFLMFENKIIVIASYSGNNSILEEIKIR